MLTLKQTTVKMSNETTENFWNVLSNFQWPNPKPVFFRLYHNEDGSPIEYSMEEQPHSYVDVDPETFHKRNMNVQVVNGRLIFKQPGRLVNKLIPADNGTPCHPSDVCVVVSPDLPNRKWKTVTNEIN
jgi:hypothetical protein